MPVQDVIVVHHRWEGKDHPYHPDDTVMAVCSTWEKAEKYIKSLVENEIKLAGAANPDTSYWAEIIIIDDNENDLDEIRWYDKYGELENVQK